MALNGQKVVIFGGTGSFGFATAEAAIADGAEVVIVSPSSDKVDAAVAKLGDKASGQVADANDDASVEQMFERVGPFDHLVVTVGGALKARGLAPVADAKTVFETRFWGQYRIARAAGGKIRPGGSISLTSGAVSQRPMYGALLGAMLNSAVEGLVRVLALEFAPVRVNAVAPGVIESNQFDAMPEADRKAFFDLVSGGVPTGRVGQVDDIAQTFLFLMNNTYMTGSAINVDGGALLSA